MTRVSSGDAAVSSFVQAVRRALEPAIRRGFHLYWRLSRGLTLGVRALVLDESGRIFLVKHTYVRGWHLPGGGVEPGETLLDALARELKEEGNIDLVDQPPLHAVYFNKRVSQRDHVALYVVTAFRQTGAAQARPRDPRPRLFRARRAARRHGRRACAPASPRS